MERPTNSTSPEASSGANDQRSASGISGKASIGSEPAKPTRSTGSVVLAVVLTHLGLLLTWSLVVPTFRAPDEHVHHDLLRHLTTTWRYPDYDGLDVSRRTLDALGTSPAFPAHADAVDVDEAPHRRARPGWSDLGPDVRNGPPNQMPQHPPLYYEAAGAALRVIDGDGTAPLDRAVWQLRLLNVLLMAPLPLIALDIARRFTRSAPVQLSAAIGVLAVPQLTHIGASVSNDPLMIVLGSLALAGAARLATGDHRWTTAVATGVLAGLALFTKGFAIPLVPPVALACLMPLLRRRSRSSATIHQAGSEAAGAQDVTTSAPPAGSAAPAVWDVTTPTTVTPATATSPPPVEATTGPPRAAPDPRRAARPSGRARGPLAARALLWQSATVAALALLFGGWWWIRNVVAYGTPQPGVRLRDRVPGVELDVLRFAGDFSERIVTSFWGSFGWFEARLPLGISAAMTAIAVLAAIVACWRHWPRLLLALPTAVALAMVLSSGWGAFKKTGISYATQGRYLFAGIAGAAVLVALGVARLAGGRSQWQPLATLVVALAMQATALVIVMWRYWAGDDPYERLRAMVAFAPVPATVTAACLTLAAVAATGALVATVALARPDRRG